MFILKCCVILFVLNLISIISILLQPWKPVSTHFGGLKTADNLYEITFKYKVVSTWYDCVRVVSEYTDDDLYGSMVWFNQYQSQECYVFWGSDSTKDIALMLFVVPFCLLGVYILIYLIYKVDRLCICGGEPPLIQSAYDRL